jgi:hypothetical protein
MMRHLRALLFLVVLTSPAQPAPPDIRPGQYVRDGDTGTLMVRRDEQNRLIFEIESTGANCHSCEVTGVIRAGLGHTDSWAADGTDSKCTIAFSSTGSGVLVEPTTMEECRSYCGARAGFDGTYRVPPSACTAAGRQKSRDRFLALYRSRGYRQAANTLQTLIENCGEFMGWIEKDKIRNDLALSQYHSGEFSQCVTTLNTTLAASFEDEKHLKTGGPHVYLPPCDFDNYIGVAKSTWFNKALCTKSKPRRQ